jgi:hypothetical protein
MQIFGREINPQVAFKRYGNAIRDGRMYATRPHIPQEYYGNADKASFWLGQQPGIGNALEFAVDNPYGAAAALAGGTVVNNLIGNPVGGAIDFLSMGLTNLKPDEYEPTDKQRVMFVDLPSQEIVYTNRYGVSAKIPSSNAASVVAADTLATQPGMQQPNQVQIPELNEEERDKFMKYTTNRTAQQILTYQALQDFLNQQPGMEGYQ